MIFFIRSWLVVVTLLSVFSTDGFDINDPATNLDSFMKTKKSTFYNETCIYLFNGTIYSRQTGQTLKKMFYADGFVIGRNIGQNDGYLDLNRVFGVFRDLKTSEILRAWINPITDSVNEVFFIANNPNDVNRTIGPIVPTVMVPGNRIVFNSDNVYEYPNPLDPKEYPKYSAGEVFEYVEFTAFFTDYLQLQERGYTSTPFVGTIQRLSQYLPWMEMGTTNGSLFFNGMLWKCYDRGLSCIPEDIWDHLSGEYYPFTNAPFDFESPNVNAWTYFKSKIDDRRARGDSDIIIPVVDVIPKPLVRSLNLDPRVEKVLTTPDLINVYFNGTASTEITGKASKHLFNLEGSVKFSMTKSTDYTVSIYIDGLFKDSKTGAVLHNWKNPITNKTVSVPRLNVQLTSQVKKEQMYTINMTGVNAQWNSIGLLFTNSSTSLSSGASNLEQWAVDMMGAAFTDNELNSQSNPVFFGTFVRFSNWFNWMMVADEPGSLLLKATFYRII